jgi:hypothetical protein
MSFYVTLPSNSSFEFYPNNKLNNFTTKLHSTIKLDGDYEVGLVDISYPQNWSYRKNGKIQFKINKNEVVYQVKFQNFDNMEELIKDIDVFCKINQIPCTFGFKKDCIEINVSNPLIISFESGLKEEFGFKADILSASAPKDSSLKFIQPKPWISSKIENKLLKTVSSLYIYTNIIDYQFVGDSYAPLLRTIMVNENVENYGKYISQEFQNTQYLPLRLNVFDYIEIDIRDDTGNPIHFEAGKVLIKLHFRPK